MLINFFIKFYRDETLDSIINNRTNGICYCI